MYLGGRYKASFEDLFLEEKFIFQAGEKGEQKSKIYQNALRLVYKLDKHKFSLGYDIMSGEDTETEQFNTYLNNYAFAHAYFGWMDNFLVNGANTKDANKVARGVQDFRLDASIAVGEKQL